MNNETRIRGRRTAGSISAKSEAVNNYNQSAAPSIRNQTWKNPLSAIQVTVAAFWLDGMSQGYRWSHLCGPSISYSLFSC